MRNSYWVEDIISKLKKHLSTADVRKEGRSVSLVAIAYVVDELKEASLEDIAELIIKLIINPLPNVSVDTLTYLQEEVEDLSSDFKKKIQSVRQKLLTFKKEQSG